MIITYHPCCPKR